MDSETKIASDLAKSVTDGTGNGVVMDVNVTFYDSGSGFTFTKDYTFPPNETVANGKAVIQADGEAMKAQITQIGTLQSAVGAVMTL